MNEFNPLKLIEESIKGGFDPALVTDVDERQLPWAKNAYEWVTSSEFLNIKSIFPLQLQVILKLFGDVCFYCSNEDFCNKEWNVNLEVGNILSEIQLLEDGLCPKCHKSRLDQYHDKLFFFPDEVDLLWGMRSGKSAVAGGMIATYVLHRMLRLPNPAAYFGALQGQELYMRFVAMTLRQAKQTNWMHFTRGVQNSDWFSQYHDFMNYHSRKKGVELVRWLNEGFAYVHKGIIGYVVGSANDVERGRTALFTSIDEIGLFEGDMESRQHNPHETYTTYEKASATIRSAARKKFLAGDFNAPTAWMTVQSSTKSKTDYIMRLIKLGRTDQTKVTSHKASWEVNPNLDVEFLENERKKDPQTFNRDYGSEPPFAKDPFIDSFELVNNSALLEIPNWSAITKEAGKLGDYLSCVNMGVSRNIPYCLSIDMGRSDCGYALSLLKLKEDDFSVVQVAGLWAIYTQKPRLVDFDGMFNDFVLPLCEKLNIKLVIYDQWQSMGHIDTLKKKGVNALQYSMAYKDFMQFRSNLYQGKLENITPEISFEKVESSPRPVEEILYENPCLHLLWQCLSVREVGNKITKGDGHDDIFRAVSLGCTFLWDPKIKSEFEYKGGIALSNKVKQQGGGLVMAGGSRSTRSMYQTNINRNPAVVSPTGRVLGSFIGRSNKN